MARHYSSKDFFRQMPNTLLQRFFKGRGVFDDIDFAALHETKPDALFKAWLALPKQKRNSMDAEFQEISEMSCEKGVTAIIDEAKWRLKQDSVACEEFIEKLASLPNHYQRAMVTYLDHAPFWRAATRWHHADSLSYWRKRKNLPRMAAAIDPASIEDLAARIRNYFHLNEGRGNNCVVEPFRRANRDYFFAYPEDYSQQSVEWVENEFSPRPHNPAFEVIFIYSETEGSLDMNFRGTYKAIEPLQAIFAAAILKLEELPPDPKDSRVYDLSLLMDENFSFWLPDDGTIESVAVKKLRLSSRAKTGERITLESDNTQSAGAVYALLDKLGQSVPLHTYAVTQADLTVKAMHDASSPPKVVTVRLTYPNSCSLKYDEMGLTIREMLAASGLEPQELLGES